MTPRNDETYGGGRNVESRKDPFDLAKALNDTLRSNKDLQRSNDHFIKNEVVQLENRLFKPGTGIDFYVDGMRFLPDNSTVTKIKM